MPPIRIFWTITAVLVMVLALMLFPIDSSETYGIPYAIALGISVGVLSYLAVVKVKNSSELYTVMYDKEVKSNSFISVVITHAITVGSNTLFYQLISHRIENLFKAEGIYTQVIIEERQKDTSRRRSSIYTIYTIGITYNDKRSGQPHEVNGRTAKDVYKNLHQGQEIEVLYLPKHPPIFRLTTEDNIARYK